MQTDWATIDSLLDQALDIAPDERSAFIEQACNGNEPLLNEVKQLLAACEIDNGFLDRNADDFARPLADASSQSLEDSSPPVSAVGPYRLISELAHGGMGRVFLAERADGEFEQRVAIKLIKRGMDSDDISRRFRAERQILARLNHVNIAALIDGGLTSDGQPWFAMEYVNGMPITRYASAHDLTVDKKLDLFERVCEAVHYAHQNLVVHRDLKPSNILVTDKGDVKLLDFGIAKLLTESDGESHTRTGLIAMTPEYAAPEQVRLEPVTTATDVYALGGVLYELLTGRRAHHFAKHTPLEVERIVCDVDPLPPKVSTDLDTIVMKALQKSPDRRYATADALLDDIHRYRTGLAVRARPDTLGYRTKKFVQRNRIAVVAAAAILLSLVGGLAATVWQAGVARSEARRAQEVKAFLISLFEQSDPIRSNGQEITARELVDQGTRSLDSALRTDPKVQSEILSVAGILYHSLGNYPKSDSLLRRSVDVSRQVYGASNPHVAERSTYWAETLQLSGNYAKADSLLRYALPIVEKEYGASSRETARAVEGLANLRKLQSNHQEAESYYRRAVNIRLATNGPNSTTTAATLRALGIVRWERFELDSAERSARQALSIEQRVLPPGHIEITRTSRVLAGIERDRGNLGEAERLEKQVLANSERYYPKGHPDVATALDDLSLIEELQGFYPQAESLSIQAIAMRTRLLGKDRAETLNSTNILSVVHWRMGELEKAETDARGAVAGYRRLFGDDHRNSYWGFSNLGVILRDRGKYGEAELLLDKAVNGRRQLLGSMHASLASSLKHQGVLYLMTGRPEKAESTLREAVSIYRVATSPRSPFLAEALTELAATTSSLNKTKESETLLDEALGIWTTNFSPSDLRLAETRRIVGLNLARQGRYDEAHKILSAGFSGIETHPNGDRKRRLLSDAIAQVKRARIKPDSQEFVRLLAQR